MLNERHIALRAGDTKGTGNFNTLRDILNRKSVILQPFSETDISVSNAQYVLLSTTELGSVNLAVGASSDETDGGLVAAELSTAVGTAATTNITDTPGNILNLVSIRDASTHEPVQTSGGRKVYGLLQCSSGTADGTAVAAAGGGGSGGGSSENTQVSFVEVQADGTLSLVSINGTIEIAVPKLYAERHRPTLMREAGVVEEVVQGAAAVEPDVRKFVVTTAFAANEVITISTGSGASSGAATASGDTVTIGASATAFNNQNDTRIRLNGVQQTKGTDAVWDSSDSFHFNVALDVDDTFEVEVAGS